ncbi:synaptogyrin-4 [Pyxicephalus adspersus]|uniref:MARVEL domain-containing protein n=1 Tax=Pyxicephalus adspersus TaxID=30357 RepID=A0AAV2ZNE0_PYXAD|nr:TPA: hypothetical protein GDO54_003373 [Pyxicephalus adspersus]
MKHFPSMNRLKSLPLVNFMLKPRTIARIFAWTFSLLVSAPLLSGGYQNVPTSSKLNCILNENIAACEYGIGVGIFANLMCVLYLVLDVFKLSIFTDLMQKIIFISDIVCSVLFTILWFIAFWVLTQQWSSSTPYIYPMGVESAHASITASFLSILCWAALSVLAILRFCSTSKCTTSMEAAGTTFKTKRPSSEPVSISCLQSSNKAAPLNLSSV